MHLTLTNDCKVTFDFASSSAFIFFNLSYFSLYSGCLFKWVSRLFVLPPDNLILLLHSLHNASLLCFSYKSTFHSRLAIMQEMQRALYYQIRQRAINTYLNSVTSKFRYELPLSHVPTLTIANFFRNVFSHLESWLLQCHCRGPDLVGVGVGARGCTLTSGSGSGLTFV